MQPTTASDSVRRGVAILVLALALAGLGAMKKAGSWNDGSRLATVECLVDYHTWAIDRSIFVRVPEPVVGRSTPYPRDNLPLLYTGTLDKLWINGHFYSDKSPVPALLLAGEYAVLKRLTGWTARDHPDHFCKAMTLGSSGLAYALAVWCVWRLGRPLGLSERLRLLLAAGLAFCTVAWTYSRQVNNHVLLLGTSMAILVEMAWLAHGPAACTVGRLLRLGLLAGLSYSIDLGAGPIICALTGLGVLWRVGWGRWPLLAWFVAAALPGVLLHHVLNYAIGGSWKPANALPEYFQWPGCPFTAETMTGGWKHPDVTTFALYCLDMLLGKCGFLLHNLPLLLACVGAGLVLARQHRDRPECSAGDRLVCRHLADLRCLVEQPLRGLLQRALVRAAAGSRVLPAGRAAARVSGTHLRLPGAECRRSGPGSADGLDRALARTEAPCLLGGGRRHLVRLGRPGSSTVSSPGQGPGVTRPS